MNDIIKGQKAERQLVDKQSIELFIDKKIADAKLTIADRRLNILLSIGAAFLAIFGILIPLFLSQQSESKVERAIEKMESDFNNLAGKQLRRPKIACYIEGKNLLNNTVYLGFEDERRKTIEIKNVGDGSTENVKMSLYVNSSNDEFDRFCYFDYFSKDSLNDKPEFKWYYRYMNYSFVLPAKDSFPISIEAVNTHLLKQEEATATAILRVFYGEPTPEEIPFSIKIEKKKDNQQIQRTR